MTTAKTNLFDKPNGGKTEDAAPELTNKGICEILLDSWLKKGFVIFSAIAAIFFALYSFRLGFADTLAEKADSAEIAQLVVGLDPNNPNARRVYARFLSEKFTAEDDAAAFEQLKKAVELAPNDPDIWLELARAAERLGESDKAKSALDRAEALAPNYSRIKWAKGNYLIRNGNLQEGFDRLSSACEADRKLCSAVVSLAWQVFQNDLNEVKKAIRFNVDSKIALIKILLSSKRYAEAAKELKEISPEYIDSEEKGELINAFIEGKQFREAASLAANSSVQYPINIGAITNPSFEYEVNIENAGAFEWEIGSGIYPQIARTDAASSDGKYSLVVIFSSQNNSEFRSVEQLVAAEPGQSYELSYAYKMNIKSDAKLGLEIIEADTGKAISASSDFVNSEKWIYEKIRFKLPETTDGLRLRLIRKNCEPGKCAMVGNLLLDDFRLKVANEG